MIRSLVKHTNINFLKHWQRWVWVACAIIGLSMVTLLLRGGLNLGLDFTGGMLIEVSSKQRLDLQSVRERLEQVGFSAPVVQNFGSDESVLIRLADSSGQEAALLSAEVMGQLRAPWQEKLAASQSQSETDSLQQCVSPNRSEPFDCSIQLRRVEFVGASVGEELIQRGSLAVLYALICILIYVTLRFEWRYAIGAIIALTHDVAVTLGLFSLFAIEFSLPVLAAILAVIGYSLNDTIVVYDRIRENFRATPDAEPVKVMNHSLNQVLSRTVLTSTTTMMVILVLLVLGGQVIQSFVIALMIGVLIGTFSSIFVAAPIVLLLGASGSNLRSDVRAEAHDLLE